MKTTSHTPLSNVTEAATFIGIDCHKKYNVWYAVDAAGNDLGKGRIEHHSSPDFAALIKRWPNARVVFEASMNCLRAEGSNARSRQGNDVRLKLRDRNGAFMISMARDLPGTIE